MIDKFGKEGMADSTINKTVDEKLNKQQKKFGRNFKMKKKLSVIIAVILILSLGLTGCAPKAAAPATPGAAAPTPAAEKGERDGSQHLFKIRFHGGFR